VDEAVNFLSLKMLDNHSVGSRHKLSLWYSTPKLTNDHPSSVATVAQDGAQGEEDDVVRPSLPDTTGKKSEGGCC